MRCESCGFENPEGMSFCGKCGTALTLSCPQYGFENPAAFASCKLFGEPVVDFRQQLVRFSTLALLLPQTREVGGGTEIPRLRILVLRNFNRLQKTRFGF